MNCRISLEVVRFLSHTSKSWIAPQHLVMVVILFLAAQILFLINIQFPKTPNFDEFHYIPSAKQFLEMKVNQNWEHPPLGKLIMAVGLGIWGDQPIGWRFMSTVFGSFTLVGMYFLALTLFESAEAALWVTLITLFNQLLYVQSRIGMLDTFMMGFLVWAMVMFCASFKITSELPQPRAKPHSNLPNKAANLKKQKLLLLSTGIFLGLATACKWFAVIPWAAMIGLFLIVRLFQKWEVVFLEPKEFDWYHPDLWNGIRWRDIAVTLGVVPLVFYFLTFIPIFFTHGANYKLSDLFDMQYKMWDGQLRVVTNHPYMSHWIDWPLMRRPIWYAFV
jgi:dolichyl-phosphate-mannose-protein mannosyltransferase